MSETKGTFKCEACGMSFNSQDELNSHNRSSHAGGEQPRQGM